MKFGRRGITDIKGDRFVRGMMSLGCYRWICAVNYRALRTYCHLLDSPLSWDAPNLFRFIVCCGVKLLILFCPL